MGNKSKHGKNRKDKFYHLAKDTGYRARSAFKLIQLDKKLDLLSSSKVAIDLCAAPGGWLQVLSKCMPMSSVIIGVDLVPIKPIPNVITFEDDITTEKCASTLSKHLSSWKADIVLNDGAPNVGQNWNIDAFGQSKLTLAAFKLATRFLRKGGTFVTKVFRSKDYLALQWTFKQLFNKVKATKPQASRHESAEIFVVCQDFRAPDKIDPQFFDIKYIFKDFIGEKDDSAAVKLKVGDKTRKSKALGYDVSAGASYFRDIPILDFLRVDDYIPLLNSGSKIVIDDEDIAKHKSTTPEVVELCKDVQVIGKSDIKLLLKWRKILRAEFSDKLELSDDKQSNAETNQKAPMTEEEKMAELEDFLSKQEKKKRKRQREKKLKQRAAMAMGAQDHVEDQSLFDLKALTSKKRLSQYVDNDRDVYLGESDSDAGEENDARKGDGLSAEVDVADDWQRDLSDLEMQSDSDDDGEAEGEAGEGKAEEEAVDQQSSEEEEEEPNPLIAEVREKLTEQQAAAAWFNNDLFEDVLGRDEAVVDVDVELSDEEEEQPPEAKRSKTSGKEEKRKQEKAELKKSRAEQKKAKKDADSTGKNSKAKKSESPTQASTSSIPGTSKSGPVSDKPVPSTANNDNEEEMQEETAEQPPKEEDPLARFDDSEEEDSDSSSDSDDDKEKMTDKEKQELMKKKLTPEQLALGHELAFSMRRRREIIESGFHRYTFDEDEGEIPEWFRAEEEECCKPIVPLSKEIVAMYRDRLKEINARPIKKVAEARARKKLRQERKIQKLADKAEVITSDPTASSREKMLKIKDLYKKAKVDKKLNKNKTYVVTNKGGGTGRNPGKGSKGPVRFVDKRLKADKRKKKEDLKREKKQKRKRK